MFEQRLGWHTNTHAACTHICTLYLSTQKQHTASESAPSIESHRNCNLKTDTSRLLGHRDCKFSFSPRNRTKNRFIQQETRTIIIITTVVHGGARRRHIGPAPSGAGRWALGAPQRIGGDADAHTNHSSALRPLFPFVRMCRSWY